LTSPEHSPPKTKSLKAIAEPITAPLLSLDELIPVQLLHRPSKRNRSPYVADVLVKNDKEREAICHVPNLDMGGKCVPGATLLVKPARDNKGKLVGPNAVNPKYGTPKCEFHAQLLKVDETALGYEPACWVGAHPSLGEKITEQLLLRNSLPLPEIESIQREVRNIAGTDMRADFVIQFADATKNPPCVLEVKTVVDTDFAKDRTPTDRTKCVFVSDQTPYRRAGIFPWGQSNQKGPNGEAVVSARAIKHVRELTEIAKGKRRGPDGQVYQAAVLFVVIRKDAEYFRANHEACPSFCKYLKEAKDAGVKILAKRVDWGDTPQTLGQCQEGPLLDVEWPSLED
jgi:DNA-binding sugar fermentation-stimulating protein